MTLSKQTGANAVCVVVGDRGGRATAVLNSCCPLQNAPCMAVKHLQIGARLGSPEQNFLVSQQALMLLCTFISTFRADISQNA